MLIIVNPVDQPTWLAHPSFSSISWESCEKLFFYIEWVSTKSYKICNFIRKICAGISFNLNVLHRIFQLPSTFFNRWWSSSIFLKLVQYIYFFSWNFPCQQVPTSVRCHIHFNNTNRLTYIHFAWSSRGKISLKYICQSML